MRKIYRLYYERELFFRKESAVMKLLKNKLIAIVMVLLGYVMLKLENDATILLLMSGFAIPIFFAKEDCFMSFRDLF